jgi:2-oxoglutarate ferredoxin oxidoreductase subunit alpha
MHTLLVESLSIDPARLVKVLHYDGTPITARFIAKDIKKHLPNSGMQTQQKEAA